MLIWFTTIIPNIYFLLSEYNRTTIHSDGLLFFIYLLITFNVIVYFIIIASNCYDQISFTIENTRYGNYIKADTWKCIARRTYIIETRWHNIRETGNIWLLPRYVNIIYLKENIHRNANLYSGILPVLTIWWQAHWCDSCLFDKRWHVTDAALIIKPPRCSLNAQRLLFCRNIIHCCEKRAHFASIPNRMNSLKSYHKIWVLL